MSENIFLADTGVSTDAYNYTLDTPLILQFLTVFTEKDFHDRRLPWIIRKLLSDFTATAVCENHWNEIKRASEFIAQRSKDSQQYQALMRRHIEKINLKGEVFLWSNQYDWDQISSKYLLDVIPICRLFCRSDFFVYAIQSYLFSAEHGIKDGAEYFGNLRRALCEWHSDCLYSEYRKLKHLWSFAHKYLLDTSADKTNLLYKLDLFFDSYLEFKRDKFAINLTLDKIDTLAKRVASTQPELIGSERSRIAQPRNVHRLFWEWREKNSLRAARYLQQCYNQHIDELGLTSNQRTALDELNDLLPYTESMFTRTGHVRMNLSYLADPKESLTPGDIFEELDILGKDIAEDYYQFDDYFEACCLSLYSIVKYQAPVVICSDCGRIYIPKQNRAGEYNYCWYPSPKSKPDNPMTCSQYHSHFLSAYTGNAEFNELDKQVKYIRKGLSKIKEQTGTYISNSSNLDTFMRVSLTSVRNHAKELSMTNQDISFDLLMVSILDGVYRYLRVKNNAGQGERAIAKIEKCFKDGQIVEDYSVLCKGIVSLSNEFKSIL